MEAAEATVAAVDLEAEAAMVAAAAAALVEAVAAEVLEAVEATTGAVVEATEAEATKLKFTPEHFPNHLSIEISMIFVVQLV